MLNFLKLLKIIVDIYFQNNMLKILKIHQNKIKFFKILFFIFRKYIAKKGILNFLAKIYLIIDINFIK